MMGGVASHGVNMDSIAIWCNRSGGGQGNGGDPIELEVHFNLWKLKDSRTGDFTHFLDIGLMLEQPAQTSHLNVFFPFLVDGVNEISDLGDYFRRHNDLVSAVFNRDCLVSTTPSDKILNVADRGSDKRFSIYNLDINSDIEVEDQYGGSIVRIAVPGSSVEGRLYFRLRIISPGVGMLTREYRPTNSVVESAFSITEVVDFKVNRKRSLNRSLLERIRRDGEVTFSRVQFFLMREAHYDYIFSHKPLTRSRLLEKEIWKSYVGDHHQLDNIVAYQWREEGQNSFSAFVKYKFDKNNWRTITTFLVIILAISIVAGTLGGLIVNLFT